MGTERAREHTKEVENCERQRQERIYTFIHFPFLHLRFECIKMTIYISRTNVGCRTVGVGVPRASMRISLSFLSFSFIFLLLFISFSRFVIFCVI